MPWKKSYTLCGETSQTGVVWPGGKKAALTVVVDYSVPCGPKGIDEKSIADAEAFWGPGIRGDHILAFLEKWNLPATFATPLTMARAFPEFIARVAESGHEIAAGSLAKEDVTDQSPEEEERRIVLTLDELEEICGTRPFGWFSLPRAGDDYPGGSITPHTQEALSRHGCRYFGNSMADDVPHYWVTDADNPRPMAALPYYYALDAQFFIFFPGFGRGSGLMQSKALRENWESEIQGALTYGRQAVLVMQPYLMQFNAALGVLERLGNFVRRRPDLWATTAGACADYWLATYPAEKYLRIEALRDPEWT